MEPTWSYVLSFLIVSVVSSFCVAIGIGGGILYVPILGFLYSGVPKGVYLSKVAILMTSFIGVSYHLYNDIAAIVKFYRKKKLDKNGLSNGLPEMLVINPEIKDENPNTESKYDSSQIRLNNSELTTGKDDLMDNRSDLESQESKLKYNHTPRIHLVLSISFVPFCILGSYAGTTFHFFGKDHLKQLITTIVSFCILATILKLIWIYNTPEDNDGRVEPRRSGSLDNSHALQQEAKQSCDQNELDQKDDIEDLPLKLRKPMRSEEDIFSFLKPYTNVSVYKLRPRVISTFLILLCLLLYYLAIRFDKLYVTGPIFVTFFIIGLFYAVKTRLSFKPLSGIINDSYINTFSGSDESLEYKAGTIVSGSRELRVVCKCIDEGIHYLLLNIVVASLSGFFSGTIGIGSGIFMVPLLQYLNVNPLSCSATSNFLTFVMSVATLSRFVLKVEFKWIEFVPVLVGAFVGTSLSLFVIRSFIKDKISSKFVNFTLLAFCTASIIITWSF